ncbi:MAG: hypothetical protein KF713_03345 [Turneriella sp.]|nr:hypothetical protein [Turneriella sp.]
MSHSIDWSSYQAQGCGKIATYVTHAASCNSQTLKKRALAAEEIVRMYYPGWSRDIRLWAREISDGVMLIALGSGEAEHEKGIICYRVKLDTQIIEAEFNVTLADIRKNQLIPVR